MVVSVETFSVVPPSIRYSRSLAPSPTVMPFIRIV